MNFKTRASAAIIGVAIASTGFSVAAVPPDKSDDKTAKGAEKAVKRVPNAQVAPEVVKKPAAAEKKKPETKKPPSAKKKGVADDGV